MSKSNRRFGNLIARYRNDAGYTQDELAQRVDVARAYIGRIETGDIQVVYPKTFNRLRKALGFPGYEILEAMGYETDAGITGVDPEVLALLLKLPPERQRDLIPLLRSATAMAAGNGRDDSD